MHPRHLKRLLLPQAWLSAVHCAMREQALRERCELLSTLLLLYELQPAAAAGGGGGAECSGHRVLELVRMIGGAVFTSLTPGPAGDMQQQALALAPAAAAAFQSPGVAGTSAAMSEQLVRTTGYRS